MGELFLVPYLRITGERFDAEASDPESARRRNVREVAAWLGVPPPSSVDGDGVPQRSNIASPASVFVDRNRLACSTPAFPPSLGIRPSALRFELFEPAKWPNAVVVSPDGCGTAEDGRGADSNRLVGVTRQRLYFPFWCFAPEEDEAPLAVVDGLSGRVQRIQASSGDVERLRGGTGLPWPVLGFRPLVCPNCGWDLPLRPQDVLFHCDSCERAWIAEGEGLRPVGFEIVDASGPVDRHLPFWALEDGAVVPAFRSRRRRALLDLASRLHRENLPSGRLPSVRRPLVGCAFDPRDARTLSAAARGAETTSRGSTEARAELLWLPFRGDGYALREVTTGIPVPTRLLDVAAELP